MLRRRRTHDDYIAGRASRTDLARLEAAMLARQPSSTNHTDVSCPQRSLFSIFPA